MRSLLCMAVLGIATLCATNAAASSIDTADQINLLGGKFVTLGTFQFHMLGGGNFNLTVTNAHGKGYGTGEFATTPTLQPFTIIEQLGTTISDAPVGACTNQPGSSCTFAINQSQPLLFEYGKNGSLLTADLQLMDIFETNIKTADVNTQAMINLTNFSGSFADAFTQNGVLQMVLLLNIRTTGIYSLVGVQAGKTIFASIASGQANPLIPEPASLATFGAALLSFGVLARKCRLFKK
jgi:hypothetical protein